MPNAENDKKTREDASFGHYLAIGGLEALINSTLALDPPTVKALTVHAGTVIKLKIRDPYSIFYLIIDSDGIEVRDEYPGRADIRVIGSLSALSGRLLGIGEPQQSSSRAIQIWGNPDKIAALSIILSQFNLRTAASRWFREHANIPALLEKIRHHDASWIRDLSPIPTLIREALDQLRLLNSTLQEHQKSLMEFKHHLARQRARDLIYLLLAFVAIMSAILEAGTMPIRQLAALPFNSWLLLATAIALILSRLQSRD